MPAAAASDPSRASRRLARRRSGRPRWQVLLLLAATPWLLQGCAGRRPPEVPRHEAPRPGATERGIASWYGPGFHGNRTANGEVYDMEALTAAHRSLPFDTLVRVHNLDNGHSVDVRINDRGPFVRGRIIDLSRRGAREIAMLGPGTARVEVEVLGRRQEESVLAATRRWTVQAGAFRDRELASSERDRLARLWPEVRLDSDALWHRVLVGRFERRDEAEERLAELTSLGLDAFVRASE